MSLIADSLYLAAIAAEGRRRRTVDAGSGMRDADQPLNIADVGDIADLDLPSVPAEEQARGIARWIFDGRDPDDDAADPHASFPGLNWLRQPTAYSDREWILAIAGQYLELLDRA
jgi:hypothetical protein